MILLKYPLKNISAKTQIMFFPVNSFNRYISSGHLSKNPESFYIFINKISQKFFEAKTSGFIVYKDKTKSNYSTKKLCQQKGTGKARIGSRKSFLLKGGKSLKKIFFFKPSNFVGVSFLLPNKKHCFKAFYSKNQIFLTDYDCK